jgi:serine/threonine protein kinase
MFVRSSAEEGSGATSIGLAPGATIGGAYTVIELIERGGMGEVYLARHEMLGKKCALKVIPPEQVTEMGWQRFQLEARAVAKLDHINLVRVTDLGIHDGCLPYYAMDYVEGQNLAEILAASGPMSLSDTLAIFMQVCDGVDCAHRSGILHRDLKPANIMVVPDKTGHKLVKILDFGLAKLTSHDRTKQSLTAVGDVFGSPFYMSPEQCNGDKLDRRSDIYSIGCTMFECLTGLPPFTGHQVSAVIFSQLEADPPSLESIAGKGRYPASMEIVMAKILRKNPVERYQTLPELRSDLEKVARGEEVQPFYVSRSGLARERVGVPSATAAGEGDFSRKTTLATLSLKNTIIAAFLLTVMVGLSGLIISSRLRTKGKGETVTPLQAVKLKGPPAIEKKSLPEVPPISARDNTPYSSIVSEGGCTWRVFEFPTDVTIGYIKSRNTKYVLAIGAIRYPVEAEINFSPAAIALKYPAFIRRFHTGDVSTISISSELDEEECGGINAIIGAVSLIGGLGELEIQSDHEVTDQALSSILKIESLKLLRIADCQLSEAGLLQFTQHKNLGYLSIVLPDRDITPLLKSLNKSVNLNCLFLYGAKTTLDGIASVATLPRLEILWLDQLVPSNPDSTKAALRLLSKSPKLREVGIRRLPMRLDTITTLDAFTSPTRLELDPDLSGISPSVQRQVLHAFNQPERPLNLTIESVKRQVGVDY